MEIPVYEKMLLDRTEMNNAWEAKVSDYQINDVSAGILKEYLIRAKSASRFDPGTSDPAIVLEKLNLLKDGHLLNAEAALFVDESDINELRLATFASDDRQTFTDTQWLTGSILRLIKEAERYVVTGTHRRSEFNGDLTRKDSRKSLRKLSGKL